MSKMTSELKTREQCVVAAYWKHALDRIVLWVGAQGGHVTVDQRWSLAYLEPGAKRASRQRGKSTAQERAVAFERPAKEIRRTGAQWDCIYTLLIVGSSIVRRRGRQLRSMGEEAKGVRLL